jgi:hypothetical protein
MRYSTKEKLAALKTGIELPVDPRNMGRPGDFLATDECAVLDLARAYQQKDDPDYVSISWECQVRAAEYFNTHGLLATLDEIAKTERGVTVKKDYGTLIQELENASIELRYRGPFASPAELRALQAAKRDAEDAIEAFNETEDNG